MKAIVLHEYGDADQLRYEEVQTPKPASGQVLVKVFATSVNPADWKIRSGAMKEILPVKLPYIPGSDVAGEVVEAGAGVTALQPGQRVMGYVRQAYAEFLTADADVLTIIPEGLDVVEAGALPLVLTTGGELAERIQPKAGRTVLVTGALGGVGRAALFLAKQYGARVIAGVRSAQKKEAETLGADQILAVDSHSEIAALPPLDAVADTIDGEVIGKLIPKIKKGGILGSVLGPPKAAEGKDIHVEAFSAQPNADRLDQLARAVQRKEFSIPIAKRYKLSEAAEAQKFAEQGKPNGKVLLIP